MELTEAELKELLDMIDGFDKAEVIDLLMSYVSNLSRFRMLEHLRAASYSSCGEEEGIA